MNRPEELLNRILEEKEQICDVFFTACGGSLVDLYPGYYFINSESESMHAHWLTARELVTAPPKCLNEHALVIVCSHGGNTSESIAAAELALERGAGLITMTHDPSSACAKEKMNPIVYDWSDQTEEKERPQGLVLRILNELMSLQESSYTKYDAVKEALEKVDSIVKNAMKKARNRTWLFAEKYFEEPFLYIMDLVHRILRHMDLLYVLYRKCSGWIAAICIVESISMDHLNVQTRSIYTFC